MRPKYLPLIALLGALLSAAPLLAQGKKVRFSISAISIAEVPFRLAQVKGFYRDEGLNVETILIRGAVGLQALVGGSVDFTSASGATIAAAVRGIPVKLVFIGSAKPQFDLMAQKEIRSVAELRGKLVGISSRGGAIDLLTQAILQKNGLTPNKDVTSIVVGGQEETALALRTGRIAAALFTPPDRKSTRLNSSHVEISYAVFCLKKKKKKKKTKYKVDRIKRKEKYLHTKIYHHKTIQTKP